MILLDIALALYLTGSILAVAQLRRKPSKRSKVAKFFFATTWPFYYVKSTLKGVIERALGVF